jgi:hypothetical protein
MLNKLEFDNKMLMDIKGIFPFLSGVHAMRNTKTGFVSTKDTSDESNIRVGWQCSF